MSNCRTLWEPRFPRAGLLERIRKEIGYKPKDDETAALPSGRFCAGPTGPLRAIAGVRLSRPLGLPEWERLPGDEPAGRLNTKGNRPAVVLPLSREPSLKHRLPNEA